MKLILAKTIYYIGTGILLTLAAACVALPLWWIGASMFEFLGWRGINILGIFLGVIALVTLFGFAFGWAEKELEKAKAYKVDHNILDKLED